ncbi:MAG: hypothetical protein HYZ57_01230 [Acidobacteria bacterium]|nr:hypothetical protein [Acidobacteriota bacterium]
MKGRRNHPVEVVLLGERDTRLRARLIDVCVTSATLVLDRALPTASPVRLDYDDTIVLGEVAACRPVGSRFLIQVQLEQVLSPISDIARLVMSLLGESAPCETAKPPLARARQA